MAKFSRSGWNNVIIFSVMGFILLINITQKQLHLPEEASESHEQKLFAAHAVILTLAIGQQTKIERIGKNWQAQPSVISGQALSQMMLTWQEIEGEWIKEAPELDPQMALALYVELAGETKPHTLYLYTTAEQLLIHNQETDRWLAFPLVIFSQLIPNQIFSS